MKKLIAILMILIVGILACGCTSQTTTPAATTAQPTAPPTTVPTTIPTPEMTMVTPTAVPVPVNTTVVPTTTVATPTPVPTPDVKVSINSAYAFSPKLITIPAGTKVTWSSVSPGQTFQISIQKSTSTGNIATSTLISSFNPSWSYVFKTPGVYYIQDSLHPSTGADGTITVK